VRTAFALRRKSLDHPLALTDAGPLTNSQGSVLDPILKVVLRPGHAAQGNRMNVGSIISSPFKGEVGRGMGFRQPKSGCFHVVFTPSPPHPSP
jgi:hypothetical protein